MPDALTLIIFDNPLWLWAGAAGLAVVAFIVLSTLRSLAARRFARAAQGTEHTWHDTVAAALRRVTTAFILIVSLYAGLSLLTLPGAVAPIALSIVITAIFIQAALVADVIVLEMSAERLARGDPTTSNIRNAWALIQVIARVAVWSLAALLILDNLGFDITALIAGLGIGGIAIALAAQNILGDLFASLAIILDKPFTVGDFIIVDDVMGTVERIGVKTTRLRSLTGEQLVCSNSDLLAARVRNYRRMSERRIVFQIGVTYETPFAKLQRIPEMLREIISGTDGVRFDRAHFATYGDSALSFEIVYHVLSPDYTRYMDIQQSINFAIFERFEADGIEFAYPTRTVHIARNGDAAGAAAVAAAAQS